MMKRVLALALTLLSLLALLSLPAAAAETAAFRDITDRDTAEAAEVLRLMGVLDGYGDGTFRPANRLTRAQFCKMAVHLMGAQDELGRYTAVTVFPDVKPSHWAAAYINLAAKGKSIIAGFTDGYFRPDQSVTSAQAVTILLRMLGYEDAKLGGVWPTSYLAAGRSIGLTDGVGIVSGGEALTRAQAARLFKNALSAKGPEGGTLYAVAEEETTLLSVDGATGRLKTSAGEFAMAHPVRDTSLAGATGHLVYDAKGKALTFLPTSTASAGLTSAAVIVYSDRSAAGLDALAGNNGYVLYKNGLKADASDLRKYDVATYYAATNSVRVCDTRVTVYYESCDPSPAAPETITALGGMTFTVLPTARESLSKFKPGQVMTLLLTADGQVAAALSADETAGNAVGVIRGGKVQMVCGDRLLDLPYAGENLARYDNQIMGLSSSERGTVTFTRSGSRNSALDPAAKTLGTRKLAENAKIFDYGSPVTLAELGRGTIDAERVAYYRVNWAGDVDLVNLNQGVDGDVYYGKASVRTEETYEGDLPYDARMLSVSYGDGVAAAQVSPEAETTYYVTDGSFVEAILKNDRYTATELEQLWSVPFSSWIGKGAVNVSGRTLTVAKDVLCYNRDSQNWITLDKAMAYGTAANLYMKDGVVHVVEVGS